jgi:hypothetical protein
MPEWISLRMHARKKFSRARKAAQHHTYIAETSMKCGFLACVYLIDCQARAGVGRASSAFSEAE